MITLHMDDDIIKSLTVNELNILKYVYEHPDTVVHMSIQELAGQVSYSSATVLRFCRKLGYSGFAELKYALHQEVKKEQESVSGSSGRFSLSSRLLMEDISSSMEGTARLIQEEQLYQMFRYLDSDCSVYLWAPGGLTSILTDYFEKLLFSVGRQKVYKIEASRMGEHILRNVCTEAILILISTTGDFAPTVRLAKLARMRNVPVISITPYTSNAVAEQATVNFRFFTSPRENRGAEFTSRLPIFYLIHLIISSFLQYKENIPLTDCFVLPERIQQGILTKAHELPLTDMEKELLTYFEAHPGEVAFAGLKELGDRLYTSGATIVRFCQKLGMKGYNEFKYRLREELKQARQPVFSSNGFVSHSIALFKDNLEGIDMSMLEQIAELLTDDRPVYIYGSHLSSVIAKYLHMVLATLDYPSILIEWQRLLNGLVYNISGDTVLFIITAHGDASRYLPVFQEAERRCCSRILVTCEPDSPLIPLSTCVLCTNDTNREYRHVDINSRLGIFMVVQILIELIVQRKRI
ncbi:MAG: MurR/RpiR family transcriptional regulator [Lachnospiraceae bacterium]|nr:MurR/RpiR family transcriptional regulator [Lachnospiraceae bacterium]